ncbi:hypothetical protein OAdVAgp04 [Bovine adenovirus 2]|uniref:Uncharacterized protein n=1 Tax=Bovine adenovirus 2 TaxID=114429 RepID=A0A9W3N270_ADEB2|nr:hypothetical protein OAdVAgp04 [Bovine adenovirus 2]AP_000004.1 IX [Ovine mastadenovirus A]AAF99664.1 unknown [Bovine adenovirus 2]
MADEGDIRTSFLTARLRHWAGVRHNALGSNISGAPVRSPEVISTVRNRTDATELTTRNITTTRPAEEQLENLTEMILNLRAELNRATMSINGLEQRVSEIERDIEPVLQLHNQVQA